MANQKFNPGDKVKLTPALDRKARKWCPSDRDNNSTAIVKATLDDDGIPGGIFLDGDLRGTRYWNSADLVLVKAAKLSEAVEASINSICVDVPLFIRLLEFAREDAKADEPLHFVAENALKLIAGGRSALTMDDYDSIVAQPSKDAKVKTESTSVLARYLGE